MKKTEQKKWFYIIVKDISIAPLALDKPEHYQEMEGPYNWFLYKVLDCRFERIGILSTSQINMKATFKEEDNNSLYEFFDQFAFESKERAEQEVKKMNRKTRYEFIDRFLRLEKYVYNQKPQFNHEEYGQLKYILGKHQAEREQFRNKLEKEKTKRLRKEKRWYRRFLNFGMKFF